MAFQGASPWLGAKISCGWKRGGGCVARRTRGSGTRLIVRSNLSSNDFRPGVTIEMDGAPWRVQGEPPEEALRGSSLSRFRLVRAWETRLPSWIPSRARLSFRPFARSGSEERRKPGERNGRTEDVAVRGRTARDARDAIPRSRARGSDPGVETGDASMRAKADAP